MIQAAINTAVCGKQSQWYFRKFRQWLHYNRNCWGNLDSHCCECITKIFKKKVRNEEFKATGEVYVFISFTRIVYLYSKPQFQPFDNHFGDQVAIPLRGCFITEQVILLGKLLSTAHLSAAAIGNVAAYMNGCSCITCMVWVSQRQLSCLDYGGGLKQWTSIHDVYFP